MKTKKGSTRFVLIFRTFVIKLPNVRYCRSSTLDLETDKIKNHGFSWKGMMKTLWWGISFNWSEFIFFCKNPKMSILRPTLFSLFGLLNIQLRGKLIAVEEMSFYKDNLSFFYRLYEICNSDILVKQDIHTTGPTENFCNTNGKLQILDYSGRRTQKILKIYGEKIYNEFHFKI